MKAELRYTRLSDVASSFRPTKGWSPVSPESLFFIKLELVRRSIIDCRLLYVIARSSAILSRRARQTLRVSAPRRPFDPQGRIRMGVVDTTQRCIPSVIQLAVRNPKMAKKLSHAVSPRHLQTPSNA